MKRSPIRFLVAAGLICAPLACAAEPDDDEFDPMFLEGDDEPAIDPTFTSNVPGVDAPQLRVLLTDAPADVDAVFVTFTEASVQACAGAMDDPVPEGEDPDDGDDGGDEPIPDDAPDGPPDDGDPDIPDAPDTPDDDLPEPPDPDAPDEIPELPDDTPDPPDDGYAPSDAGPGLQGAFDPAADEGTCENGTWVTISNELTTFDLLSLQDGITVELALAELPPGDYGQIRLMLDSASVVIDDQEYEVIVPPGKLELTGGFALEEGMQTEVTIDFDAGQSLHYAPGQGWMMTPVISVISETMAPLPEPEPEPEPADDPDQDPAEPPDPDADADDGAEP